MPSTLTRVRRPMSASSATPLSTSPALRENLALDSTWTPIRHLSSSASNAQRPLSTRASPPRPRRRARSARDSSPPFQPPRQVWRGLSP
eukprot:14906676-Heterocapsa_arctica.AAC.1